MASPEPSAVSWTAARFAAREQLGRHRARPHSGPGPARARRALATRHSAGTGTGGRRPGPGPGRPAAAPRPAHSSPPPAAVRPASRAWPSACSISPHRGVRLGQRVTDQPGRQQDGAAVDAEEWRRHIQRPVAGSSFINKGERRREISRRKRLSARFRRYGLIRAPGRFQRTSVRPPQNRHLRDRATRGPGRPARDRLKYGTSKLDRSPACSTSTARRRSSRAAAYRPSRHSATPRRCSTRPAAAPLDRSNARSKAASPSAVRRA